jgi:hypothetical protein
MMRAQTIHCGKQQDASNDRPPVRKHDRTWARNNKQKSEAFADHLERTFQTNAERTMDNLRRIEETRMRIYTSDLPQPEGTSVATFADDIAIMAVGGYVEEATNKLQSAADEISNWTSQWLIKLNGEKSIHVNFTNQRCLHIPIIMNGKTIPHSQTAKYLGMTLDAKWCWKVRV